MIVVTGGNGVLGRALVQALLADGSEPVELVSSDLVDLRDAAATRAYFESVRPRLVYHLAARVHGLGGNIKFPAEMFTDNVRINTNVIDAARIAGCEKLVATGTVAVYPSSAILPVSEAAIWMGEPHSSEVAYGHAKRSMLAQLDAYKAQYGLSFAYAILTNIYGPHDRFDIENGHVLPSLVAKFFKAKREGGRVEVWGTGRAQRDFITASDAARALMLLAAQADGPVNVATGRTVKISDVVGLLAQHTGINRVTWDASKPDGQIERSYDVSRLAALGFSPLKTLQSGLKETFDWYEANYPAVRS